MIYLLWIHLAMTFLGSGSQLEGGEGGVCLSPQENSGVSGWQHCWLSPLGGGGYWYPASRGQGCWTRPLCTRQSVRQRTGQPSPWIRPWSRGPDPGPRWGTGVSHRASCCQQGAQTSRATCGSAATPRVKPRGCCLERDRAARSWHTALSKRRSQGVVEATLEQSQAWEGERTRGTRRLRGRDTAVWGIVVQWGPREEGSSARWEGPTENTDACAQTPAGTRGCPQHWTGLLRLQDGRTGSSLPAPRTLPCTAPASSASPRSLPHTQTSSSDNTPEAPETDRGQPSDPPPKAGESTVQNRRRTHPSTWWGC